MIRSSSVRVTGPLERHREGLWDELIAQGYAPLSARNLLRVLAHLSRWLEDEGLEPKDLDAQRVEQFVRQRRAEGYTCWRTSWGLEPLLEYLRRSGSIPEPESRFAELTPLDLLLEGYESYLLQERGILSLTAKAYLRTAREFLLASCGAGTLDLERLNAAAVTSFLYRQAGRSLSVGRRAQQISQLRSLLRYLYVRGRITSPLAYAVPGIARRRLAALPKALAPRQARDLLHSCDRRTSTGRRDFAALLLMLRMGLRAREVAALCLEDVDWARGEIKIRGKLRREDRLPLSQEVGQALVAYLKRGRPPSGSRKVFLRAHAPHRELRRGTVSSIAERVGKRIGLPFSLGAHRLRHTAATTMLRKGASLWEIAQVLRHRQTSTTAIYAKVDRPRLRELARSWKGAKP